MVTCEPSKYASPKVYNGELHTGKTDIWSLGWVAYEHAAFKPAFHAPSKAHVILRILNETSASLPARYPKRKFKLDMCVHFTQQNPKQEDSWARVRYQRYMHAKTLGEALRRGTSLVDRRQDLKHGHLRLQY